MQIDRFGAVRVLRNATVHNVQAFQVQLLNFITSKHYRFIEMFHPTCKSTIIIFKCITSLERIGTVRGLIIYRSAKCLEDQQLITIER